MCTYMDKMHGLEYAAENIERFNEIEYSLTASDLFNNLTQRIMAAKLMFGGPSVESL